MRGDRRHIMSGAAGVLGLACIALCAVAMLSLNSGVTKEADELLLKVHLAAHEPYSPPPNMYLWWGPSVNHRMVGAGEHIRHLLAMGNIEGGEWRDPMFLGQSGVATFRSQRFRRISESCCSTIVIPPLEWDFPVYNTHKIIGQRIRNYVANGNMLIMTGGILDLEFINSYFFFNIELVDGNYSPGPFRKLPDVPEKMKNCPSVLPQKGIAVTAVKKESLPSGTQVLWGTPRSSSVFMIDFCEAQNPMEGLPPIKVLPRDCPTSKKEGRPCSCGHIMYIGYNYKEQYPTRWDPILRAAVEILAPDYGDIKVKKMSPTPQSLNLDDWQEVTSDSSDVSAHRVTDDKEVHSHSSLKATAGDDEQADEQKLAMQQLEIHHLEHKVDLLNTERKAVHQYTEKKARTSALDELNGNAQIWISSSRANEGRGSSVGERSEKLVLNSVAALARDVRKVDSRVDMLAQEVDSDKHDDDRRHSRRSDDDEDR